MRAFDNLKNFMKIFSSAQIRAADAYTIRNEPIPSIDLMERASLAFVIKPYGFFAALATMGVTGWPLAGY